MPTSNALPVARNPSAPASVGSGTTVRAVVVAFVTAVAVAGLTVVAALASPADAGASGPGGPATSAPSATSVTSATSTTMGPVQDAPGIIPHPNSGRAPDDPGDRGGALQLAILGGIVGGVGVIVALAVRDARRRAASGRATETDRGAS